MKEFILLECGCRAAIYKDGKPHCIVHNNNRSVSLMDNLTKRKCQCNTCGDIRKSNADLPGFEWRGAGSPYSKVCIKCGHMGKGPHENPREHGLHVTDVCDYYTPHGPETTDSFDCWCSGEDTSYEDI